MKKKKGETEKGKERKRREVRKTQGKRGKEEDMEETD